MRDFDPVSLEIMWSRLLNVTEEMWTTILRTAVSTIIASANDFGCEVLDVEGRSIAHAYRSMPVFNMTMPNVTKEILKIYPANKIKPGDMFLTNDPWLCAGHLPDIAVVSPSSTRAGSLASRATSPTPRTSEAPWMPRRCATPTRRASSSPSASSTTRRP